MLTSDQLNYTAGILGRARINLGMLLCEISDLKYFSRKLDPFNFQSDLPQWRFSLISPKFKSNIQTKNESVSARKAYSSILHPFSNFKIVHIKGIRGDMNFSRFSAYK
jgi:hypothetical protein